MVNMGLLIYLMVGFLMVLKGIHYLVVVIYMNYVLNSMVIDIWLCGSL